MVRVGKRCGWPIWNNRLRLAGRILVSVGIGYAWKREGAADDVQRLKDT